MQYYMIEWDREEPDEIWRLYLELDSRGCLRRKIETYRMGLYQPMEVFDTTPTDPRQLAQEDGSLTVLNRIQFEDLWDQARSMPDSFMGLFF